MERQPPPENAQSLEDNVNTLQISSTQLQPNQFLEPQLVENHTTPGTDIVQ